jgi:amidase
MSTLSEYDQLDALGLAQLVRNKEIEPLELVDAAIERIEARNPSVNAVIHAMFEQARSRAVEPLPVGPFTGVPFLLKDLLDAYAEAPMTSGSRFLQGYVPDVDSEFVTRLKAAGVIVVGKTNAPEMGLTPYTEPELHGPTRNPWNPERTAGGSSGGSGAAVAARMAPMASGGDGGGSIRIPASCCGLFGLKPTRGRTPTGPVFGELWEGLVVSHVLTRSVRDSAAMLDAVAGPDAGAPYSAPPPSRSFLAETETHPGALRIAYTAHPFLGNALHRDCIAGLDATVSLLDALGHNVEEATPHVDGDELALAFATLICGQVAADITEAGRLMGKKPTRQGFEPATWALSLLAKTIPVDDYIIAVRTLQRASRSIGRFFEDYDLLLTPTLAAPPPPVGSLQPSSSDLRQLRLAGQIGSGRLLAAGGMLTKLSQQLFDFIGSAPLYNFTGQPAMSVPLHWNGDGLPIGMQFAARFGEETTLLRLAGQLEQAAPWMEKTPGMVSGSGGV